MSDPRRLEGMPAVVVTVRAWLLWMFGSGFVLGEGLAVFHRDLGVGPGVTYVGAAVVALAGLAAWLWPRRRRGLLHVTKEGIWLGEERLLATEAIRQAYRSSRASGANVHIQKRNALGCRVELDSESDAQALLQALAQDSAHATAAFPATAGGKYLTGATMLGATVVPIGLLAFGVAWIVRSMALHQSGVVPFVWAVFLAMLASAASAAFQVASTRAVVVGADGLLVRGLRGRTRAFYPYRQLRDVRRDQSDVLLTLVSGKVVRLGVGGARSLAASRQDVPLDALLSRIADARARYAAGSHASDLASALAKGDRDVGEWRREAETLLGDRTSYRTPAVPAERVWAVLEDPTEPPATRAAAAVALRARLDTEGRARLRVAGAACASAELRGALEAVDEDDDESVDRALHSLARVAR